MVLQHTESLSETASPATDHVHHHQTGRTERGETITVVALLMALSVFLYHDFLFGHKLYLFKDIASDSLNVFYPKYVQLSRYLRTSGLPGWSFNVGLGQDFYPGSLGNPFDLFIILFPPRLVGFAIIYSECAKMVLSGLFVYKAFRINLFSIPVARIGCLLYAFSGYMIVGSQWTVFSVEVFHVALLLYAFERYLADRTVRSLVTVFFLIAAFVPFNLYLDVVFLFLYGSWRLWCRRETQQTACNCIADVLRSCVAGIGLAAPFFLPALNQMAQSPRGAGIVPKIVQSFAQGPFRLEPPHYYLTMCLRMFANDLEGSGNAFAGWGNYLLAPALYIGLAVILLVPLAFIGSDRRYRVGTAVLLLIPLIIIVFPFLRHLFWLGSKPYIRFLALMFSTFMLLAALHALEQITIRPGRKFIALLVATLLVCTGALVGLSQPWSVVRVASDVRNVVTGFLIVYAILISACAASRRKNISLAVLLVATVAEIATINSFSINGRPVVTRTEYEGRTGYNDYSADAVRRIRESDPGFYRIVKEFSSSPALDHQSLNDGMMQDFYGVSSYQSFNQPALIHFLSTVGVVRTVDESNSRWINMLNNQPLLLALLNTKYVLTKKSESLFRDAGYEFMGNSGDVTILKNGNFLPFGYSYGQYIPKAVFEGLTPEEKQIALLRACLPEDGTSQYSALRPYIPVRGSAYTLGTLSGDIAALSEYQLKLTVFQPERIEGTITLVQPRMLALSIPFDAGWRVFVDGKREMPIMIQGGLTGVLMETGTHNVQLKYRSPWRRAGVVISLLTALVLIVSVRRRPTIMPKEHGSST